MWRQKPHETSCNKQETQVGLIYSDILLPIVPSGFERSILWWILTFTEPPLLLQFERSPFHHETTQLPDQPEKHPSVGKQERTQNSNNLSHTYLCEQVQMGGQERPEAHGEGGEGELWLQVNRGRQESA